MLDRVSQRALFHTHAAQLLIYYYFDTFNNCVVSVPDQQSRNIIISLIKAELTLAPQVTDPGSGSQKQNVILQ